MMLQRPRGVGEMRLAPGVGEKARLLLGLGVTLVAFWAFYRAAVAFVGPGRAFRGLGGARRVDRLDGPSNYYLEIDKD